MKQSGGRHGVVQRMESERVRQMMFAGSLCAVYMLGTCLAFEKQCTVFIDGDSVRRLLFLMV